MTDDQPEFGPEGHLPERASKRARKIVLRTQLGIQWIVGAVVAGVVIVGAGLLWLAQSDDPPARPWVAVGALEDTRPAVAVAELDVLIVAVGRPRAFTGLASLGLSWCAASQRVESPDGRVWSPTGRAQSPATPSLGEHPTLVHDGVLYVDPTATVAGPDPAVSDPTPAC